MRIISQLFLACCVCVMAVGICIVAGCRSGDAKAGSNTDDFICFQDIGVSDHSVPPLAVCINNPNQYPEAHAVPTESYRMSKYINDFDSTFLVLIKMRSDDFREMEIPVSSFVSKSVSQVGSQEYGAVRVTIVVGSRVQSKNLGRRDFKLLLGQVPVDVLQRHPDLANNLRDFEKEIPLRLDTLEPNLKLNTSP